jgi:archaellum component FlaC
MLVNKNKTKKKKEKNTIASEDTIQSFRSWIRKLEQTTNSLSSRLSAVEKRISKRKSNIYDNSISENTLDRPISKIFESLRDEKNVENIEEITNILDDEFNILQEELIQQQTEITTIKEKFKEIDATLTMLTEELKKENMVSSTVLNDVTTRVEKIESREPPTLKIGKMKIPIEITGIMGGILAILIAVLLAIGISEVVTSPVFMAVVGLILISSAVFKTLNLKSLFTRHFKKSHEVTSEVEDAQ